MSRSAIGLAFCGSAKRTVLSAGAAFAAGTACVAGATATVGATVLPDGVDAAVAGLPLGVAAAAAGALVHGGIQIASPF